MHANRSRRQFQQAITQKACAEQDAMSFFNILTSAELLDVVESQLPVHRERKRQTNHPVTRDLRFC